MSWRVDEAESCGGSFSRRARLSEEVVTVSLRSRQLGCVRGPGGEPGMGRRMEMGLRAEEN